MPNDFQTMVANGALLYIVFLLSTILHEAAHAWAAAMGGDKTAYHGGQVSLDPIPHIRREPIGMILLPIISLVMHKGSWILGFASAPYDPAWASRHPKRAALMALAGPMANLLLVVIAGAILYYGVQEGEVIKSYSRSYLSPFSATNSEGIWNNFVFLLNPLFGLNIILFVLNLFPIPPFDGSSVIMLAMDTKTARRYQEFIHNGTFGLIGLIVVFYTAHEAIGPVFRFAEQIVFRGF